MRSLPLLAALACTPNTATAPAPVVSDVVPTLDRAAFNQTAATLNIPLFWVSDDSNPGVVDASELEVYTTPTSGPRSSWIADGQLGSMATKAIEAIHARISDGPAADGTSETEKQRRAAVLSELASSRVTLVVTDLSAAPAEDRALIGHLVAAAHHVEHLHALQRGTSDLAAQAIDPESRSLFYRNQGPWCEARGTEDNPVCSAVSGGRAKQVVGVYPADIQTFSDFCDTLSSDDTLLQPFVAVRRGVEGQLVAVPYSEAWPKQMQAAATELEAGAAVLGDDEAALKTYLLAAAAAFRTDDWFAADVAWAAMNQDNSRWYIRVGPDETYWDPCNRKAGFHMSLARVNPASKAWQKRLDPVKADMEHALAQAAGPPYVAREVGFDLPEFIDIVLNAGDARSASGATIGQSLPNWGPVADAGGRTVAMTNLFTDADSIASRHALMESVFCPTAMPGWSDSPEHLLMSTVLHEASHNLGPAHDYRVDGKTDEQAFGGSVASVMEELKAQTAALYLSDWLVERKVLTKDQAHKAHMADLGWSFGKISEGFYTSTGKRKAYPQLAAVNVGELLDAGALTWSAEGKAANGADVGCMEVHTDKMGPAIAEMNTDVLQIKATADKARAVALLDAHTAADAPHAALFATISERMGREPSATFVYSIRP